MKGVKIQSPVPSSSPTSTPCTLDSPTPAPDGASSSFRCDPSDLGTGPSIPEPKPLVLTIIDKQAVEKPSPSHPEPEPLALAVIDKPTMKKTSRPHDLRVDFGERHHKCLYEANELASSSAKGAHPEGVQEEPGREIPSMSVPSPDVAGSSSVLVVEGETGLTLGGAFGSNASVDGVFVNRDTHAPTSPPSCDEMVEKLKRIPRFSDADLPSSKMFEIAEVVILRSLLYLPNLCIRHLADI